MFLGLLIKILKPEPSIANRAARGVGCSEWLYSIVSTNEAGD
jgi:hypothetical protein